MIKEYSMEMWGGNIEYLSIRQDRNNISTPADYADDTWIIYLYNSGIFQLSTCEQPAGVGSVPDLNAGQPCHSSNTLILSNKVYTFTRSLVTVPATFKFYLELELTLRDNPADPAALDATPIDNPSYKLETRISPPAHSWN